MLRGLTGTFAATSLLCMLACCASAAEPCSLKSLAWMAGTWHNAKDPRGSQEHWVIAPQDVLMGSAWEFPERGAGYAEIMTIRAQGDTLSMLLRHFDGGLRRAWEEREDPMIFTVSNCGESWVSFDGQGAHQGEHMTYRRSARKRLISADFIHHGTPDHEEWDMLLSSD
jgi:hypothetical protein